MPSEIGMAEPWTATRSLPQYDEDAAIDEDGPCVVILYNDDVHAADEVVSQIQKATGYAFDRCVAIMVEAHTTGRAITYTGGGEDCERAAGVLRQIRLQVETDRF